VRGLAATWYIYDARALKSKGILPFQGPVDPRWDAANPELLYYSEGARLMKCNVRTGDIAVVHDFTADFPGLSVNAVWTRYEGSPSLDGRFWGFMTQGAESQVGFFLIYDQQTTPSLQSGT
jgi:hypothetical protein